MEKRKIHPIGSTKCFRTDDYQNSDTFKLDLKLLDLQWNYVDHISNFHAIGDYQLHDVCGESIILIKTAKGIKGYFNVCRHRGSILCTEYSGNKSKFVCPYHGWSYTLDGDIEQAPAAPFVSDCPEKFSLIPVRVEEYEGLIFVGLNYDNMIEFSNISNIIDPYVSWHGLKNGKIASRRNYMFKANWKLVVENFLECFHCFSNHPQLCSVYSHPKLTGSESKKLNTEFILEATEWERKARSYGHPTGGNSSIDVNAEQFSVAFRMPIKNGKLSLAEDNEPLAPLMGKFKRFDGGETFGVIGPLLHFSLLNDHGLLIRVNPISPLKTDVQLTWIVDRTAKQGEDYQLDRLTWLWNITVKQDRTAVQRAQLGSLSRFYKPGQYTDLEQESEKFARWYNNKIKKQRSNINLAEV